MTAVAMETKVAVELTPDKKRRSKGALTVLTVLVVAWMLPLFGLLITSFRSREAATETGWWAALFNPFAEDWTVANFTEVIDKADLGSGFINSLGVAIPATVLPILIAAFAAYAFTFMNFRFKDVYFAIIIGLLVIPIQVALVPVLRAYVWTQDTFDVQVVGTYPAAWIVHAAFAMPLCVYILRNYMATLPGALIEAARVDGASHHLIFWRLIVPMSVPALASFAIFQFLWVWNDLLVAQIFLGTRTKVLTQSLYALLGRYSEGWQQVAAGSFFTLIIPLVVFFSLQRFFVRGLTAGAVK